MGRTACTESQCLYKGALYVTVELHLYSHYGPYSLYRVSVPVQGGTLLFFTLNCSEHCLTLCTEIRGFRFKCPCSKFLPNPMRAGISQLVWRLATGWTGLGANTGGGKRFSPSPDRPDRLWGPHSLLFNGYRGPSPPRVQMPAEEVDHILHLVTRLRMSGAIPLPAIYLHGVDRCSFIDWLCGWFSHRINV